MKKTYAFFTLLLLLSFFYVQESYTAKHDASARLHKRRRLLSKHINANNIFKAPCLTRHIASFLPKSDKKRLSCVSRMCCQALQESFTFHGDVKQKTVDDVADLLARLKILRLQGSAATLPGRMDYFFKTFPLLEKIIWDGRDNNLNSEDFEATKSDDGEDNTELKEFIFEHVSNLDENLFLSIMNKFSKLPVVTFGLGLQSNFEKILIALHRAGIAFNNVLEISLDKSMYFSSGYIPIVRAVFPKLTTLRFRKLEVRFDGLWSDLSEEDLKICQVEELTVIGRQEVFTLLENACSSMKNSLRKITLRQTDANVYDAEEEGRNRDEIAKIFPHIESINIRNIPAAFRRLF